MGFQIQDKDGNAISINELDKEAALFWGKEVHPKYYANSFIPKEGMGEIDRIRGEMCSNWFDVIGYQIHNPEDEHYTSGWNNVKVSLWTVQSKGWGINIMKWSDEELLLYVKATKKFLKPFFDLIDHWESKGYKPIQVKE